MKYRRLDQEELEELKTEFVNFLSSNTITADDWQKIKAEDPVKAEGLIDIFSDIVFEKTLQKIEYLEHRSKQGLNIFHCQADKMVMVGLTVEGKSTLDFTKNQTPEEMITQLRASGARLRMYQAEKKYDPNRSAELYKMMEQGCLITNDHLFNTFMGMQGEEEETE